jgi:hypothetical protein
MYLSRTERNLSFSKGYMVLIINLLSSEKKKKLPLAPLPSPASNTLSLFYWMLREAIISSPDTPSISSIF